MDISLFMSASRPQWWQRMYESLRGNKCSWEIVAVGPNKPTWKLPDNFVYEYCPFKPTQCYAMASKITQGELIGYTADDSIYNKTSLTSILKFYKKLKDKKTILTQRTIENGKDVTDEHHFFRHCKDTPVMAPMAFLNREWFWELGGYERDYISGQAENSIVMDAYADGGEVINVSNSIVYLNHEKVHGGIWNKIQYHLGKNSFRSGYLHDRRRLEETWVKEGFGTYNEKTLQHGTLSSTRLLPHQPFTYYNIFNVAQGEQGRWVHNSITRRGYKCFKLYCLSKSRESPWWYEALSKIPKRFIEEHTQCCEFGDNAIMLTNPIFQPMQYTKKHRRWMKILFNKGDWKITYRTCFIPPQSFKIEKERNIIKDMP